MLNLSQINFTVIQFIFNLFHTAKQRLTPPPHLSVRRPQAHSPTRCFLSVASVCLHSMQVCFSPVIILLDFPVKSCRKPVLFVFPNAKSGRHIPPSPNSTCHFPYYLAGSLLWQHIFLTGT